MPSHQTKNEITGKSNLTLSVRKQISSDNSPKKTVFKSKLSRSRGKTKKYCSASQSKCTTPQIELDLNFLNSNNSNTNIKISQQFLSPQLSNQKQHSQLVVPLPQNIDDGDTPLSQDQLEIPPTPGSGFEYRLINRYNILGRSKSTQTNTVSTLDQNTHHYNIQERSKSSQTDTVSTLRQSSHRFNIQERSKLTQTDTVSSLEQNIQPDKLSSLGYVDDLSPSIVESNHQKTYNQTENKYEVDVQPSSISQNDFNLQFDLSPEISDSNIFKINTQQLFKNLEEISEGSSLSPLSLVNDFEIPPSNVKVDVDANKTGRYFTYSLKDYVTIQITLTLNSTNFVGANKLSEEIYDHVLDRIILIYNSLVNSSINEHDNLFFVVGNIYIYIRIDRILQNVCLPDQEFIDGLYVFSKQIAKAIEEFGRLE